MPAQAPPRARAGNRNPGVFIVVAATAMVFGACRVAAPQSVRIYVSSAAGDRLTRKPDARFTPAPAGAPFNFRIDAVKRRQTVIGFGASFLEAGLICLNSLSRSRQEDVLRSLFDPRQGAGFSAMKSPIAGTDFMSAGPFYTYDDTPGDFGLRHFSIGRDLGPDGLITFIRRARRYGLFVIEAPMDYPPDWMLIDPVKHQDVDRRYYGTLARYYVKYLQTYARHGAPIDYLSLFNEPGVYTKISYAEIDDLLKNHVGPALRAARLKTKLMLSEAPGRDDAAQSYPIVLDDPGARRYIAAIAYHGYDFNQFDAAAKLHRRYPDVPLWMTEICYAYEAGYPRTAPQLPRADFDDGNAWANQIISDLEAGAGGWTYWNMILDEHGGPWCVSETHGNPRENVQQPVVIIDRRARRVTYTGLYYYLAHFSRFVRPGSVMIGCSGHPGTVRAVAFLRPDRTLVCELLNNSHADESCVLGWRGEAVRLDLPARSITTCLWKARRGRNRVG